MLGSTLRLAEPVRGPLRGIAGLVFWVLVWQVASIGIGQELLVPAPLVVADTLWDLAQTPQFWLSTGASLLRMSVGFLLGVVVGCLAAVATTSSVVADVLLSGFLRTVRAAPVASFVILALVWIPTGQLPAFIAFAMVVPLVWDTMAEGLRHQDRALLEMAEVFRLGRWQTARRVQMPALVPFFVSASTNAMGLAWKSGVAAEVISRPEVSIGGSLQDAKVYLETPAVFAWTITAVVLSLVLEKVLRLATARWSRPPTGPAKGVGTEGAAGRVQDA